jgi:CarD family transcriptional regulator
MKKIGDYIVYRRDTCKITDIKKNYINGIDYYSLVPIKDESLKIEIPIDLKNNYLRDLISKEDIEKIIDKIPKIEIIECNDKMLENEYRNLINDGSHEALIKIIKTTYLRNKVRLDNNKKLSYKDQYYFELAENYLYNEFRIVLNMSYEDTKQYIVDRLLFLENSK